MKPYIPTIVTTTIMLALYVAQNRGLLAAEQVMALMATIGVTGTAMAKPVRGAP